MIGQIRTTWTAVMALVVSVAGCDTRPRDVLPDVHEIAYALMVARGDGEAIAILGKNEEPRGIVEGRRLYIEATNAHNNAVARIRVAIAPDGKITQTELRPLLESADQSRLALKAWAEEAFKERKGLRERLRERVEHRRAALRKEIAYGASTGAAVDAFISLADLAGKFVELHNKLVAEDRNQLNKALDASKWRNWDEIKADGATKRPIRGAVRRLLGGSGAGRASTAQQRISG